MGPLLGTTTANRGDRGGGGWCRQVSSRRASRGVKKPPKAGNRDGEARPSGTHREEGKDRRAELHVEPPKAQRCS